MSKLKTTTYELRDVAIMQAPVSFCNHRGDVDNKVTICEREVYPIFVAPMASVTDENNYQTWLENGLTPVVPRSVGQRLSFDDRMEIAKETFVSISLKEAQEDFTNYMKDRYGIYNIAKQDKMLVGAIPVHYICIDIAHGTLSELYDACKNIKSMLGSSVEIMTGNVANLDDVYSFYANAGIDWVRAGIGGGSRCTTSANLGVHVGLATLIDKLNESRKSYMHSHNGYAPTKIIADGGIGNFDDINKSIALGADAVMCGKLIAETEEACGEVFYAKSMEDAINGLRIAKDQYTTLGNEIPEKIKNVHATKCGNIVGVESLAKSLEYYEYKPFRTYFGMSTKIAQEIVSKDGKATRTSEGISRPVEVKYPIAKWVDNMQSYLRSAMTYTNSRTIKEMQENAQVVILGGSGDAAYRK